MVMLWTQQKLHRVYRVAQKSNPLPNDKNNHIKSY